MGPFVIQELNKDLAKVVDLSSGASKVFHVNRLTLGKFSRQFIAPSQQWPTREPFTPPPPKQRRVDWGTNPFFNPSEEDNDSNPRIVRLPTHRRHLSMPPAGAPPPAPSPSRGPPPPVPPRSPATGTPGTKPVDTPGKRITRSEGPVDEYPNVMDRPIEFRHRTNST